MRYYYEIFFLNTMGHAKSSPLQHFLTLINSLTMWILIQTQEEYPLCTTWIDPETCCAEGSFCSTYVSCGTYTHTHTHARARANTIAHCWPISDIILFWLFWIFFTNFIDNLQDRVDAGMPTAIAVSSLIAVGTSHGLVLVFGKSRALLCSWIYYPRW